MRGLWKRALILICAVVICLPSLALAEFSPRWNRLEAGEGVTLTVSGSLDSATSLSKQSLDIVNDWLSRLEAVVSVGRDSQAELRMDGETLLSASVQRQSFYNLTVFTPSGSAYLSDPGEPDALTLLAGAGQSLPDVTKLPALYAAIASPLYAALEQAVTPKTVRDSTSIKNAAASASYMNYTFKGEDLNRVWPEVLSAVLPVMKEILADQPAWYAELSGALSGLDFSGECRFKRFLDKEGGDMGLQFTGQAAKDGDKRKITLFGGFTPDKGGYISLSLPAVSGKNSLKMNLAVKMTAKNGVNTLAFEGSYTRVQDGATTEYTLDGNLKNTIKEEAEEWSGKITVTATEKKVKTTWTFTPALTFDGNGLYGQVSLQKKEGNSATLKAVLNIRLEEMEKISIPAAQTARDLRMMSREQAQTAVYAELAPLTGALAKLMAQLPEEERTLLLHDLRTDAWMNGPAVSTDGQTEMNRPAENQTEPAPVPIPSGEWVVEEDE